MKSDLQTIIIGAGPVGLLLANLLGQQGKKVLVAERRTRLPEGSMAIGITPPSLHILKKLELDQAFTEQGIAIAIAKVFEHGSFLGDVDFSKIPTEHRYILSLPQSQTIAILKENLKNFPSVQGVDGVEFAGQTTSASGVSVQLKDLKTGATTSHSARYLVGCDGARSAVREQLATPFPGHRYRSRFFMADFDDRTDLGSEACLYFGSNGSVEAFPLPGGQRRWIIQVPLRTPPNSTDIGATVVRHVQTRTGINLADSTLRFESSFRPQYRLAKSYLHGRVLLCGDAAHMMSPIGGQGMNTGFADALHLARALATAQENPAEAKEALADYSRIRRHSFRVAAHRAGRGMWLGTRTGLFFSALRHHFIARILFRPAMREKLAPYFAMLTIPGSPLAKGALQ